MNRFLSLLFVLVAVSISSHIAAQNLVTFTVGVTGVPGTTSVTLDATGGLFIDLPWPVPNENAQIPPALIPPNATPNPTPIPLGDAPTIEQAKLRVARALAGYLMAGWIAHGLERLSAVFADLGDPPAEKENQEGTWEGFSGNLERYTWLELQEELEENGG